MEEDFESFLINPPQRRGGKKTKRRKTMTRRRTKDGRFAKKTRRSYSSNPRRKKTTRRRSYRHNPGMSELMLLNPPRRHRRRSYRRNPSMRSRARKYGRRISRGFSTSGILPMLKEGAYIGVGALVVNNLYNRFIPDSLKTDKFVSFGSRAVLSIAGGMLISKFAGSKMGNAFAVGGVAYSVMVLANQTFPEYAPLGEYYNAMGSYYAPPLPPSRSVAAQPDGLNWEGNIPERLSPANRF